MYQGLERLKGIEVVQVANIKPQTALPETEQRRTFSRPEGCQPQYHNFPNPHHSQISAPPSTPSLPLHASVPAPRPAPQKSSRKPSSSAIAPLPRNNQTRALSLALVPNQSRTKRFSIIQRRWFSGKILRCHQAASGSRGFDSPSTQFFFLGLSKGIGLLRGYWSRPQGLIASVSVRRHGGQHAQPLQKAAANITFLVQRHVINASSRQYQELYAQHFLEPGYHQTQTTPTGPFSREDVSQALPADLTTQDDQLQPNFKSSPTLPVILSALADAKLTTSFSLKFSSPRDLPLPSHLHPLCTNDSYMNDMTPTPTYKPRPLTAERSERDRPDHQPKGSRATRHLTEELDTISLLYLLNSQRRHHGDVKSARQHHMDATRRQKTCGSAAISDNLDHPGALSGKLD
ncbi:uncharacterized protein CLUP02_09864 [Colletotrichum lupini]|uniref:Uncharacterized protein n=1 Tax=Colletotrichum lupini TaxID=145971 RepID=A0A9Q8WI00_9PEZI|nr:uncharacterized protein CLUP02_09864 [Colletotrichum lupini]UQC84368.1 hypothetical protein CLUP02_09864 [Colletotrichum lupini]